MTTDRCAGMSRLNDWPGDKGVGPCRKAVVAVVQPFVGGDRVPVCASHLGSTVRGMLASNGGTVIVTEPNR